MISAFAPPPSPSITPTLKPPTPTSRIIYITEETETESAREHSQFKAMSIEAIKAICAAIGGTGASLLTAGLVIASKSFEDVNDSKGAEWIIRGAAACLGIAVACWGATAYFCILDRLAKRSNSVSPQTTTFTQPAAVANQKPVYSINSNDLA